MRMGDTLFIGRSARTNDEGIRQVGEWCRAIPVEFEGCLHLKSAVTQIGPRTLLLNPEWVDAGQFGDVDVIEVEEPHAANALRIGDTIVLGSYERTAACLRRGGFEIRTLDVRELAKAEAGVTCCSLIIP